jgi:hypothetical protein
MPKTRAEIQKAYRARKRAQRESIGEIADDLEELGLLPTWSTEDRAEIEAAKNRAVKLALQQHQELQRLRRLV